MSFYTSLTGLNAATAMLGVTSNNIANVGTTGFKRSRADFGDIFATSPLQKASSTVGQGVSLKQVSQEFSQGNISFSANALDLAITGDGFFPMRSADGLQETYTRNGSFLLNEQYNVVNSAGQRLMAATVDSTGSANVNDRVVLTIPQKTSGEAKQTSAVSLGLNFPADAPVIKDDFNRTNPATYNKSTAFTVYDAGGNGYLATVYYVKTKNADQTSPTNTWQTHVFVGEDPVNASLQQASNVNGEKLYVNQYGQLAPYSQVKDELTTAKTMLFSLNDLTDTRQSVPAAVSGKAITSFDFSNGDNFKIRNDTANAADLALASVAAIAANDGTVLTTDDEVNAVATAAVTGMKYPKAELPERYAQGLRAAVFCAPSELSDAAVLLEIQTNVNADVTSLTGTATDGTVATAAEIKEARDNISYAKILESIQDTEGDATLTVSDILTSDYETQLTDAMDTLAAAYWEETDPAQYLTDVTTAEDAAVSDLGTGASEDQIAAAKLTAKAKLIAADNALNAGIKAGAEALGYDTTDLNPDEVTALLSDSELTAIETVITASLGAMTNEYYDSVKVGLSQLFNVDVDGSGAHATLDLGYLADTDKKIIGNEMAAAVTNTLNRAFGDEAYFDLSQASDRYFQVYSSGYNSVDQTTGAITENPIPIKLVPGETPGLGVMHNTDGTMQFDSYGQPIFNAKKVTIDQMVHAIQSQLDAAHPGTNTIKASYDFSTSSFKFTDGANVLKLDTNGTDGVLKNDLFKLSQTSVTLSGDGHYDAKVIPNGQAVRLAADQRYGMAMAYDSVNKVFTMKSGTTGDKSSLSITGVKANSLGTDMLGLTANGLASEAPVNLVTQSSSALRGIASTPAVAVGTTPLKNISNNFAVDETNNKFVVTVDGVKGTVLIPVRSDYSLDTLKAELQKGINAMGGNNAFGDPVTVNGVEVGYDDTNKRFTFTSGTTGAASFIKISGSADWGLDQVEAARGTDSTWIKPTQHKDVVSGVSQPKYIDGQGNETTSGDGFDGTLPAWSPIFLTKGELTFSTGGKLVSPVDGTQLEPVYLAGGKGVLTINIDYGASTQYTSPFAVLSQSQDGAPEGDLVGVTIGNDGLVSASFSNGTQKSLAKILLANFSSPVGLRQMGDSTFLASAASGKATLGNAGSAGFGTLRAGATERANVDLTQELVDLITAQRNFQANAKAIETSSTMTSAIINLRS
jgi:flagellar hook-basal body protein